MSDDNLSSGPTARLEIGGLSRRIGRLGLVLAIVCIETACARHSQRDAASESLWNVPSDGEIRALLAERMKHNGVGVVVGIVDSSGRRVVSHGRSGAGSDLPLDGDTVFQIGSVTKTFTTLLLAEMVTRGEVTLDDPAAAYLPRGVGMPERGRPITLRDLATHMSGLPTMPSNFDLAGEPDPYEAYSVDQLHDFLSSHVLEREPGAQHAYSNLGVAVLGRFLANRTGMDYEALLKERILGPLGLTSTSIELSADQLRRLAPGYDTYLKPVRTWEMATLPASGSLRSTANDMLTFVAAYLGYEDTQLESAMALQLRQRASPTEPSQALGWRIRSDGVVRHSGGKQGYRSGVAFNPQTGIGAVVLVNARTYDLPMNIALHLVAGEPLEPAPHAPEDKARVQIPHGVLEGYGGRYRLRQGGELEIARNGSSLVVRYPSNAILEFLPMGPREFFYNAGNDDISFQVDPDGHVTGLTLYGDGKATGRGEVASRVGN